MSDLFDNLARKPGGGYSSTSMSLAE